MESNLNAKSEAREAEDKTGKTTLTDSETYTLKIWKNYQICICKPLIPLKLALFCYYGGGAAIQTFLSVFYKQRGLTLSELSTVYIISPAIQLVGPTLSGIIADKLGRSKPVLVANMLITMTLVFVMLHVPRMNFVNCDSHQVNLSCRSMRFEPFITPNCFASKQEIEIHSCNIHCGEDLSDECIRICEFSFGSEPQANFTLTLNGSIAQIKDNECFYNVSSVYYKNTSYLSCFELSNASCHISCFFTPGDKCISESNSRTLLLFVNMTLLIFYFTTLSNCYRFMDVTSMELVKVYKSDFAFHRFFSICGNLVFSPVAGAIISLTTPEGAEKNYASVIYFFIATNCLTLIAILKLKVVIKSPGKQMWKKSWNLMKNPDNVAFALVLFVLGTEWAFTSNFRSWYLEDLGGNSVLLGLTDTVISLYSLPLLLTSKWWLKKIGASWIFVSALIGYLLYGIGYSFLRVPWAAFICEATSGLTYHLLWVAVVTLSHDIAAEGLVATVISTAGAVHFSLGKCSGSLVGGLIMSKFGGRIAYRVMAAVCFVSAVLYSFYLIIRQRYFTKKKDFSSNNGDETQASSEKYTISK